MIVVVDTNVFISAIMSADGSARQIIRLCLEGSLAPLIGNALFSEFEDVFARERLFANCQISGPVRRELLDAFLACCTWVPVYYLWRPNLPDEADNHVMELAVAGNAKRILTFNKRDFLNAELTFPNIVIQSPAEFLRERSEKQ